MNSSILLLQLVAFPLRPASLALLAGQALLVHQYLLAAHPLDVVGAQFDRDAVLVRRARQRLASLCFMP